MEEYLKDISDGKLYSSNDMVKVGCHDCNGCSACCCDMGESILLDPMDVWRLERNLGQSFEQLLAGAIDLHVEDGLILPQPVQHMSLRKTQPVQHRRHVQRIKQHNHLQKLVTVQTCSCM